MLYILVECSVILVASYLPPAINEDIQMVEAQLVSEKMKNCLQSNWASWIEL